MVKTEDPIQSAPFPDYFSYNNNDYSSSSMFDMFYNHREEEEEEEEQQQQQQKSSYGFMELLGFQDTTSIIDHHHHDHISVPLVAPDQCLEVIHQNHPIPTTPNSNSSYSSASSGGARNDHDHQKQSTAVAQHKEEDHEEDDQQNLKKELRVKKTNQQQMKKKQREPRIAFMTKSEVDHLEDGYRWRKYGQKAVKNSPFPRGYYRCTNAKCNVKKRVERCFNDPTLVVTTYEGKHTHPSPTSGYPNSSAALSSDYPGFFHAAATFLPPTQPSLLQQQHVTSLNNSYLDGRTPCAAYEVDRHSQTYGFLSDHGLLQDIVPSLPE